MNRDILQEAIELCSALYRITDKFPNGEVLSGKIRVLSIDIVEDSVYYSVQPTDSSRIFRLREVERKIRTLFAYFSIAEKRGWVDSRNFDILRRAYRGFYSTLINISGSPNHSSPAGESGTGQADPDIFRAKHQSGENPGNNTGISAGIKRRIPDSGRKASLSARQSKILDFLRGKDGGEAISDIAGIVGASNKTAEREIKKLIQAGRVRKQGNTRGARFLIAFR